MNRQNVETSRCRTRFPSEVARGRVALVLLIACGLVATALLSGCSSLSVNPQTGVFTYARLGNQTLTGLAITRLDDGSIEVKLEAQDAAGNSEAMQAVMTAAISAVAKTQGAAQ